ncbi:MAG: anti-sigma factor [Solirubrobacteraceae bacterium]|jgi:anti-sigma factor RsiW
MSEHDRFRDECGAYVLGALEEREADELRAHLESCIVCRDDVERLTAVAEVLGLGVPQFAAPPELRSRVLDAVRAQAAPFAPAPARARVSGRRWPAAALPWFGGLAGAALALGVVLGALVIAPGAPATRIVSASVAPAARWHAPRSPVASLRETGTQGELVVSNLPPAPSGRIYEVWVRRGGRAEATAVLFDATAAGTATVAVPDLDGASAVMVTAERLGGASSPTMAPLILAQLS